MRSRCWPELKRWWPSVWSEMKQLWQTQSLALLLFILTPKMLQCNFIFWKKIDILFVLQHLCNSQLAISVTYPALCWFNWVCFTSFSHPLHLFSLGLENSGFSLKSEWLSRDWVKNSKAGSRGRTVGIYIFFLLKARFISADFHTGMRVSSIPQRLRGNPALPASL